MFKNHPSVLRIIQEVYSDNDVSFDLISDSDVINTIDSSKAYHKGNIPPQILKINVDIRSMNYADITLLPSKKRTAA